MPFAYWILATQLIAARKPLPQKLLLAGTEAHPTKTAGPEANLKFFPLCSMPYALCSMLYALCPLPNPQSAIYNPQCPWGWLGFCNSKKPQKSDQFSNKDKTYQLQNYVCYCFIGKNYLLFIFVVFLLSWKKPKSTDNLFTDNCPVDCKQKYLTF